MAAASIVVGRSALSRRWRTRRRDRRRRTGRFRRRFLRRSRRRGICRLWRGICWWWRDRLARLILSDIVIYHADKVDRGIRDNNFFDLLKDEIEEGRQYYESRVPMRVRRDTEIFSETLQQFVQMKREEMEKLRTGT